MKTPRLLLMLPMALTASLSLASADGVAQPVAPASHVMSDFPKLYPAAYRHWRQLLPSAFAGTAWLSRFEGTASQIRPVTVGGTTMIYGSECKPHDCGPNSVQVLASRDGSRVVGLVTLAGGDAVLIVGSPTPAELNCLKVLDGDNAKVTSC